MNDFSIQEPKSRTMMVRAVFIAAFTLFTSTVYGQADDVFAQQGDVSRQAHMMSQAFEALLFVMWSAVASLLFSLTLFL